MMSWTQQVGHVFRKDAWEQRWLLGFYGLLLLIGLLEGTELLPEAARNSSYAMPMSVLLRGVAAFLSASIILDDSPTGPRAFWASLPYERSAMFAAKSMMLVLILLGTAAALVPPLLYLDVSGTQLTLQLVNFGMSYATLLVATAVFAGMVSHLRTVLLAYVAAAVMLWLVLIFLPRPFDPSTLTFSPWLLVAALAVAMVALSVIYRSRRVSRTRQAVCMLACALLLLSPFAVARIGPSVPEVAAERVSGWSASLSLAVADSTQPMLSSYSTLTLAVAGNLQVDRAEPAARVELLTTSAAFTTDAGRTEPLAVVLTHRLSDPPVPLARNIRWLSEVARSTSAPGEDMKPYSSGVGVRASDLTGLSSVQASGHLEFREARQLAAVAFGRDTTFSVNGWRFTVQPTSIAGRPYIRVGTVSTTIDGGGAPRSAVGLHNVSFALVNEQRGEARALYKRGFSSSGGLSLSPNAVDRTDGLLASAPVDLPPSTELAASRAGREFLDPEWLRGAKLVIYEWTLTGTSPVSLSTDVRRPATGSQ